MKRNRESGQALVIMALTLTVLAVAAGLAIDMGYLRYERRRMQTAADSAAIAAANALPFGLTFASAAYNQAAVYGFDVPTVAVQNPPLADPSFTDSSYVAVIITKSIPTFFMRVVGVNSQSISARAVAKSGSGPSCIYALGTGPLALTTIGPIEMDLVANGCSITDDGDLEPSHASDHITASSIGDATGTCTALSNNPDCLFISPTPQKIVPAPDPLSYLNPPPAPPSCSGGMPTVYDSVGTSASPIPIPAGIYRCGIQITGNAYVNFTGGTYILGSPNGNTTAASPVCMAANCAALLITGNSNVVTGTDVTFFNQTGSILLCVANANSTNDATGCPDWGATPQLNLKAPTSGDYAGILFYQDRGNSAGAIIAGSDDFSGAGNYTFLEGALYFPSASLSLYDLTSTDWLSPFTDWTNTYTILDAAQVILSGKINLGSNYSSLPSGSSPIKAAVLVE